MALAVFGEYPVSMQYGGLQGRWARRTCRAACSGPSGGRGARHRPHCAARPAHVIMLYCVICCSGSTISSGYVTQNRDSNILNVKSEVLFHFSKDQPFVRRRNSVLDCVSYREKYQRFYFIRLSDVTYSFEIYRAPYCKNWTLKFETVSICDFLLRAVNYL